MSIKDIPLDLPPDLNFSDEELQELSEEFVNAEVDRLELRPTTGAVEAKNKAKAQEKAVIAQAQEVQQAKQKQQSVQAQIKPRAK